MRPVSYGGPSEIASLPFEVVEYPLASVVGQRGDERVGAGLVDVRVPEGRWPSSLLSVLNTDSTSAMFAFFPAMFWGFQSMLASGGACPAGLGNATRELGVHLATFGKFSSVRDTNAQRRVPSRCSGYSSPLSRCSPPRPAARSSNITAGAGALRTFLGAGIRLQGGGSRRPLRPTHRPRRRLQPRHRLGALCWRACPGHERPDLPPAALFSEGRPPFSALSPPTRKELKDPEILANEIHSVSRIGGYIHHATRSRREHGSGSAVLPPSPNCDSHSLAHGSGKLEEPVPPGPSGSLVVYA